MILFFYEQLDCGLVSERSAAGLNLDRLKSPRAYALHVFQLTQCPWAHALEPRSARYE